MSAANSSAPAGQSLLQKPMREELVTVHRGEGQPSLAREIGRECLNNLLVLRGLDWRRGRN